MEAIVFYSKKEIKKMEVKAYGFFKCNKSEKEVRSVVPRLGGRGVNSKLELFTIDAMIRRQPDLSFLSVAFDARAQGINYVLEGTCPGADNLEAAKDVTTALNRMYASSLYRSERKEPFCGAVYYEEHGKYLEME